MSELEREADALLTAGKNVCDAMSEIPALYSIAISLKRIADMLELSQKQPILMSYEEYAKHAKGFGG